MDDIKRAVKRAGVRLFVNGVLWRLALAASVVAAALVASLVVARVFSLELPWVDVGLAAGGIALVAAVAWALATRRRGIAVARELDERADLRESLSTAMCFAASEDPWSKAVVATATDRARQVDVRRAIPIEAPRAWPLPLGIALAFAIVWFTLPELDLGGKKVVENSQDLPAQIEQAKLEAKTAEDKVREQLERVKLDVNLDTDPEAETQDPLSQDPDAIRRDAIRRLTTLSDRIEQLKQDETATQLDAMKQAMRQLRPPPGQTALNDMARAMAAGRFDEAKDALEQLQQQLGEGSLTPEQKEQVQKQLANLADQLKKAAEDTKQIEKQLQQAGLSPDQAKKAATDPQAMREALEKLQSLTPEQKEELERMVNEQKQASSNCQGMGENMDKMAQGMGPGNISQEALEGMEGLGGMLSELEMMQGEMAALEAAQGECQAQLAKLGECMGGECNNPNGDPTRISPWSTGNKRGLGMGSGGPGRGNGANTEGQETPFDTQSVRSNVHRGAGPIVGTRLVYGDQVRGESLAEFKAAVSASSEAAAQAIANQQVPPELEGPVKSYFGNLEKRGDKPAEEPAGGDGE